MEEDIMLLEEMKQNCLTKREYIDPRAERKAQAIENLIKGYRELEEWKREKGCSIQEVYELFIPKSKIKEKLEELEKQIDDLMQNGDVYNDNVAKYNDLKLKIVVLQELMEDK